MTVLAGSESLLLDHPEFGRPLRDAVLPDGIDADAWAASDEIRCGEAVSRMVDPMLAVRWPGFAATFARFATSADPQNPVCLLQSDRAGRLVRGLRDGTATLHAALPCLGPEVWSHADGVTLMDSAGRFLSLTVPVGPPGLLAIDQCVLNDPSRAAELLFHEALHAKLRRIEAAGRLLCQDSDGGIEVAWRTETWPATRGLAAVHVYVHLVVLGTAMSVLPATEDFGLRLATTATARARYLLDALASGDALTDRGREFVEWLAAVR